MIRQDKLGFLINFFKVEDYALKVDVIDLSESEINFFVKFGIVEKKTKLEQINNLIDEYIPINKHYYLAKKIKLFVKDICMKNPKCSSCKISNYCDFYNNKNCWA